MRGSAPGLGDRDLVGDCFEDMLQKAQISIECEQAGARLLSNAVGEFGFCNKFNGMQQFRYTDPEEHHGGYSCYA